MVTQRARTLAEARRHELVHTMAAAYLYDTCGGDAADAVQLLRKLVSYHVGRGATLLASVYAGAERVIASGDPGR